MKLSLLAAALAAFGVCSAAAADVLLAPASFVPASTDPERMASTPAEQIKAPAAYSMGASGAGVTVAVLDSGVNYNHVELSGLFVDPYNAVSGKSGLDQVGDTVGHGTQVVSNVAAHLDGSGFYGTAYDAKILPVKIFSGSNSSDLYLAKGLYYAKGRAPIITISVASSASLPYTITYLKSVVDAGQLVTIAAGNGGSVNPQNPARYARESWAKGQIIAVGAVDANNVIASFSNRAGDTKDYFLVVPGVSNPGASYTSSTALVSGSGTSYAAPVAAAAAAVVKSAWGYLTAAQIAGVLFDSATDLGDPGVDAVYGHGVINLEAAMQPIGSLSVPLASGGSKTLGATALASSSSTASGLLRAADNGKLRATALDAYGRNFEVDLGSAVSAPRRDTVNRLLAGGERPYALVTRSLDRRGSSLVMAAEGAPSADLQYGPVWDYLQRGAGGRPALAGFALNLRYADGSELALGAGGLNRFFGLAGANLPRGPALDLAAFDSTHLTLVPGALQLGYRLPLTGSTSLKAGVLSSALADASAAQYGFARRDIGTSMTLLELEQRLSAGVLGLQLAHLDERDGALGARGAGALALSAGLATDVLGVHGGWALSDRLSAGAYFALGQSRAQGGDSLVQGVSALSSSTFGLGFVRAELLQRDDRLSLSLSQPLRAQSGSLNLNLADGVDGAGNPVFVQRRVGLAADARELRSELDYRRPLSRDASLSLTAIHRHNPDHVRGDDEAALVARYALRF